MDLFPLFLKLDGRRCLVVGAGRIAAPKIKSLLRCGARIRVIAPEASPRIREAAQAGKLVWLQREFRASDLTGAFLVVAATNSPALHAKIFRLARRADILCNSVDEPSRCDFYYPAVVRRGPLQIAISTAGNSPALAKRLRRELENQFGPEYAAWVDGIGKSRAKLMDGTPASGRRAAVLELSSDRAFRSYSRRRAVPHKHAAARSPHPMKHRVKQKRSRA